MEGGRDGWEKEREGRKHLGKYFCMSDLHASSCSLVFSRSCFGCGSGCLAIKHVSIVLMNVDFRVNLHCYDLLVILALGFLVG